MNDIKRAASTGVVASLEKTEGEVRLVFDDVSKHRASDASGWDHKSHFTEVGFDSTSFESLSLSEAEFAQIGENLVMRLLALGGQSRK